MRSGFTVSNPVQTWGGADAENVQSGEKQVKRFLQHRDRLVSVGRLGRQVTKLVSFLWPRPSRPSAT